MGAPVDARTLLGRRLLVGESKMYVGSTAQEWKLIEVSPSGVWFKFQNLHGLKFWKKSDSVTFIEVLELVAAPLPSAPEDMRHPKENA